MLTKLIGRNRSTMLVVCLQVRGASVVLHQNIRRKFEQCGNVWWKDANLICRRMKTVIPRLVIVLNTKKKTSYFCGFNMKLNISNHPKSSNNFLFELIGSIAKNYTQTQLAVGFRKLPAFTWRASKVKSSRVTMKQTTRKKNNVIGHTTLSAYYTY